MKKLLSLLFVVALTSSCDINTDPIELTATTEIEESIPVSLPQTSGVSVSFNETINQDLSEIITNFSDVNGVNINSLSYQYRNATGNVNAVIESATLVINGTTVATISNVNISQASSASTVFEITDTAILDQLEDLFLTSSSANIQFSGSAVSEDGPIDFDIAVSINLTVSL